MIDFNSEIDLFGLKPLTQGFKLAYFLNPNDIAKASKYFTMMEELDERSWLINGYINKDNDCMNENWFISGKNRFKNTDWQVSVDNIGFIFF